MRYLVTKEIKSETQVVWKLYFRDFMFLIVWIAVNWNLKDRIHVYLQAPFCIFAIVIGILLILPSGNNPKRRQYQSIALYLTRKKGTLYYMKEERDEQQKRNPKYKRKPSGIKL